MLKIYNILQKMEFLKEVATLEYEEWADNPEEDKEARIERKIEKIISLNERIKELQEEVEK